MCCAKSLQSCSILCDPVDCSPAGSSVHWILQARTLEWVAISYPRASSQPRDLTHVPYIFCTGRWVHSQSMSANCLMDIPSVLSLVVLASTISPVSWSCVLWSLSQCEGSLTFMMNCSGSPWLSSLFSLAWLEFPWNSWHPWHSRMFRQQANRNFTKLEENNN